MKLKELKEINELKIIKIFSIVSLFYLNLMIIIQFLNYYTIKMDMSNPLIPESLIDYSYEPYIKNGLVLSTGLLILMILKLMKQNLLLTICFVVIMIVNRFIN